MNNPEELPHIESKEEEPKPSATVFMVRHGETEYDEEFSDPNVEEDLTDTGKEQIQEFAEEVNNEIDDGEKVYIMKSQRTRAKTSADIITETLEEKGHEATTLGGGRPSLNNVKMLDKGGADIYKKKGEGEQYLADMEDVYERLQQESDYYIKSRKGAVENPVTQNMDEYRGKVKTFVRRIIEIARQRDGDNDKLVLATHGEWLDSILEQYLSKSIETTEDSASKGEFIKMEILSDKLKFYFRGQEVEVNA